MNIPNTDKNVINSSYNSQILLFVLGIRYNQDAYLDG